MAEVAVEAHTEPTVQPQVQGCELVMQEIAKYDWHIPTMTAIAHAESNCRPEAKGDTTLTYEQNGRTYGYSLGSLQVRILPGREHCDTYDVATNVSCAYSIYKSQGYSAWSVYSNGKYMRYM